MNEYLRKSTCTKCASSDLLEGFTMMEKNVKKTTKQSKTEKNQQRTWSLWHLKPVMYRFYKT